MVRGLPRSPARRGLGVLSRSRPICACTLLLGYGERQGRRVVQGEVTAAGVAILVACHDDAATIRETIDSLRGEAGIELVVVDDGSTDPKTLEVLAELERAGIRILHQGNAGPAP